MAKSINMCQSTFKIRSRSKVTVGGIVMGHPVLFTKLCNAVARNGEDVLQKVKFIRLLRISKEGFIRYPKNPKFMRIGPDV